LDEMDPKVPPASMRQDADVFQSEAFIQNLGEALSRFRMNPIVGRLLASVPRFRAKL